VWSDLAPGTAKDIFYFSLFAQFPKRFKGVFLEHDQLQRPLDSLSFSTRAQGFLCAF
jgi:hypothetical protein